VAVRAIHATGYLAWGCSDSAAAAGSGGDPLLLRVLLKGLLKLSAQKNEEITFAGMGTVVDLLRNTIPVWEKCV